MGTVIRFRNLRFVIYTADRSPPHVHVLGPGAEAKIEIESLRIVWSVGFRTSRLRLATDQVKKRQRFLLEAWNEIHED